ncbi:Chaperone protein DnaJ [compost metagenome]
MKTFKTHYDNLQVAENASPEVIKGAYKYLSQKWHPDKNQDQRERAERITRIINQAYEVLSDPERRRAHDRWIREQRAYPHDHDQPEPPRPSPPPHPGAEPAPAARKHQERAQPVNAKDQPASQASTRLLGVLVFISGMVIAGIGVGVTLKGSGAYSSYLYAGPYYFVVGLLVAMSGVLLFLGRVMAVLLYGSSLLLVWTWYIFGIGFRLDVMPMKLALFVSLAGFYVLSSKVVARLA